jgi:hypothetical protein
VYAAEAEGVTGREPGNGVLAVDEAPWVDGSPRGDSRDWSTVAGGDSCSDSDRTELGWVTATTAA